MNINDNMISYLEGISKLKFNENEKEKLKYKLKIMLDYVKELDKINISTAEEFIYSFNFSNNFREDNVCEGCNEDIHTLSNIEVEKDYFVVPKIFN